MSLTEERDVQTTGVFLLKYFRGLNRWREDNTTVEGVICAHMYSYRTQHIQNMKPFSN